MTTTNPAPAPPVDIRNLDTGQAITVTHDTWLNWCSDGRDDRWYVIEIW
jgi:hypothetical protein